MNYAIIAGVLFAWIVTLMFAAREVRKDRQARRIKVRLGGFADTNAQYLEGLHPKWKDHDFLKEMR